MSVQTVKLHETDSDFLEKVAAHLIRENGEQYFYMPFWFKKVGNGLFAEYAFDELPEDFKNELKKDKNFTIINK